MLGSNTGEIEVIRIPIKMHVVQKISDEMSDIALRSGDGEIKLLFRNGRLSVIETMIRSFFGGKKPIIN